MTSTPTPVALCSFSKATGWRIVGVSRSDSDKVNIFKFGRVKALKIPCPYPLIPGRFCNPAEIVAAFLVGKYTQRYQ